jgi:hypothetical protein
MSMKQSVKTRWRRQRAVWRGVTTYVYVSNHHAGFAPATVEQFQKLWSTDAT